MNNSIFFKEKLYIVAPIFYTILDRVFDTPESLPIGLDYVKLNPNNVKILNNGVRIQRVQCDTGGMIYYIHTEPKVNLKMKFNTKTKIFGLKLYRTQFGVDFNISEISFMVRK